MKRRDIIAASAGIAGGLISGLARSAVPCPPSPVTVAGGGSATTTCAVSGASYATNFQLTENPISEGGWWTNGGAVGLAWQNVRTSGGMAYGVGPSAGYNDCIACLKSTSGISSVGHSAQGMIHKAGGYAAPSSHEVGLYVGQSISAGVARGYEVNLQFGTNALFVRWNGASGDFDVLNATGPGYIAVHGDQPIVTFRIVGGNPVITLSVGGIQKLTYTDSSAKKIVAGQPGMGFFARSGAGLDMTKYCLTSFSAASL
jgi:hypothetical protein